MQLAGYFKLHTILYQILWGGRVLNHLPCTSLKEGHQSPSGMRKLWTEGTYTHEWRGCWHKPNLSISLRKLFVSGSRLYSRTICALWRPHPSYYRIPVIGLFLCHSAEGILEAQKFLHSKIFSKLYV